MKHIRNFLFSMPLTGILLVLFAVVIGVATFLENDYGTESAKALVYSAKWFEILLFLIAVNLTGSIFKYKMYRKEKLMVLVFHMSFLFILLGAGFTRYIGFEGVMHIREGESSQVMLSDMGYLMSRVRDGGELQEYSKQLRLAPVGTKNFKQKLKADDKEITVRFHDYITNAEEIVTESPDGVGAVTIVYGGMGGENETHLLEGERMKLDTLVMGYGPDADLRVSFADGTPFMTSNLTYVIFDMMANTMDTIVPDTTLPFLPMKVYNVGGTSFVMRTFMGNAKRDIARSESEESTGLNILQVELASGTESKVVNVRGRKGVPVAFQEYVIDGTPVEIGYGSRYMYLPFAISLQDFQLERYPGSDSPSSYASEVTLIDQERGVNRPYRIYMNNVLNYRGYRFFQSSYDTDEHGTVLSVNHDAWGTWITYFGYVLLAIGLFLNFFTKSSRLQSLGRKAWTNMAKGIILVFGIGLLSLPTTLQAANRPDSIPDIGAIDKAHAARFGELLVQDNGGRIKPINTLSAELLRKIARKSTYRGMSPEQVMLGMMTQPELWQFEPIIKVRHKEIMSLIGAEGTYAAFANFLELTPQGYSYKLYDLVNEANQKKPNERGTFDKEILRVDERLNIVNLMFTDRLLRIFPEPGHENNKWLTSDQATKRFTGDEKLFAENMMYVYKTSILMGLDSADWSAADENLGYLAQFQHKFGKEIIPSDRHVAVEISYNKINPFNKLFKYYGLMGFILVILIFIRILKGKTNPSITIKVLSGLIIIGFLVHTVALAMRWYISGHAPWSDSYESMIYIAWAAMFAGVLFVRKWPVVLAVATILASTILMTAGHSWMDPEITPLVPVLKSYWLIIHVAVITASYGFLAIGMLLGFVNLLLYNFKTSQNHLRLDGDIAIITRIIEMVLIIGLALLSVGTFLGGVWANESWGRYWGWDPKETWALVTIIWYSFILHMRLIPGLKSRLWFNFWALVSFGTVLMTYFGVNFYLSGLHSYASGDPAPLPKEILYALFVIIVVTVMGYINHRKHSKGEPDVLDNSEKDTEEPAK